MSLKSDKLCITRYCTTRPVKGRRKCEACRRRAWVKKNLIRDKYNKLRGSATRRGISFELTIEEFKEFCEKTQYHLKSGLKAGDLTVDRVNATKGYSADNIQVMTRVENSTKYIYQDRRMKAAALKDESGEETNEDYPF